MSRGVRDLRELICVSRLTVRGSDDEAPISDDELHLSRALDAFSLDRHSSGSDNQESLAATTRVACKQRSPDSGIGTNGVSPDTDIQPAFAPKPPPADTRPAAAKKRKRKKKRRIDIPMGHDLPKSAPLPPVSDKDTHPVPIVHDFSSEEDETSAPVDNQQKQLKKQRSNFDDILTYIDGTLVSEWLVKANSTVAELTKWCHTNDNFVKFAHFWLQDFPDIQRLDIFKLEHSILLDHLHVAFSVGRDAGKIRHRDCQEYLQSVFREYPEKLLSSKGPALFLDHLDILTSERATAYRKLLSDVHCSTKVKVYAQWTLAIRAFTLVSVWSSVVGFYRRLAETDTAPPMSLSAIGSSDPNPKRIQQTIRLGYVDLLHYMLWSGKVKATHCDEHGRTLVFMAVMHHQTNVLHYLLNQVKPAPDANKAADTGNTPLHAAANNGDVVLVTTLLSAPNVQVNVGNSQCDNATPLHLAAMHGHVHCVEVLLVAKADAKAKMGDLTVEDIARDFGHVRVLDVVKQYS